MKLKAQNTIEIISLVVVVLVVVVSVFMFMNGNSTTELANLSKINATGNNSSYSGSNESSSNLQANGAYSRVDVETAGALSSMVAQMKESELTKAIENKSIDELFSVKSSDEEDVFDLANKLINELSLPVSPFDKNDLSSSTKESLVKVAVDAKVRLGNQKNATYTMYTAVLAKIIS